MAKFKVKDTSKMTEKQLAAYNKQEKDWENYGRTEAMFKGGIRSAVRKVWLISKGRSTALKRCRVPFIGKGNRKFLETCEECHAEFTIGEKRRKTKTDGTWAKKEEVCLVVHHIDPCPDIFHPEFLSKMFCSHLENPSDGYKVLCQDCHKKAHEELKRVNDLLKKVKDDE